MIEREMDAGVFVSRSEAEATSFANALESYAKEVTSQKRSSASELSRIQAMQRHPLALRSLASIRGSDIGQTTFRPSYVRGESARTQVSLQCAEPHRERLHEHLAFIGHVAQSVCRDRKMMVLALVTCERSFLKARIRFDDAGVYGKAFTFDQACVHATTQHFIEQPAK